MSASKSLVARSERREPSEATLHEAPDPLALSRCLRLDWAFVHITALFPSSDDTDTTTPPTLADEEIFPREVELRYRLAASGEPAWERWLGDRVCVVTLDADGEGGLGKFKGDVDVRG